MDPERERTQGLPGSIHDWMRRCAAAHAEFVSRLGAVEARLAAVRARVRGAGRVEGDGARGRVIELKPEAGRGPPEWSPF